MFLVDLNQVLFAAFFASVKSHTNIKLDVKPFKHMALNSLRKINKQFRKEWGNMVITSDSQTNWRKDAFPEYKAGRKEERDKTDVDWSTIYMAMDELKEDLRTYFPYKFLQVERCEADDIIGVIVRDQTVARNNILIVSGDKDFRQLHKWYGVSQYDPVKKQFLIEFDSEQFLHNHILEGDRSDGIPNVLSDDDTLVLKKRQTRLTTKAKALFNNPQHIHNAKYDRNYYRNKRLIDLYETPAELVDQIWEEFYKPLAVTDNSKLMNYMMKNRLRNLIEFINDF